MGVGVFVEVEYRSSGQIRGEEGSCRREGWFCHNIVEVLCVVEDFRG